MTSNEDENAETAVAAEVGAKVEVIFGDVDRKENDDDIDIPELLSHAAPSFIILWSMSKESLVLCGSWGPIVMRENAWRTLKIANKS